MRSMFLLSSLMKPPTTGSEAPTKRTLEPGGVDKEILNIIKIISLQIQIGEIYRQKKHNSKDLERDLKSKCLTQTYRKTIHTT